jgi:hypothetical protein
MSVGTDTRRRARWSRWLLAALLTATGLAHLAWVRVLVRLSLLWWASTIARSTPDHPEDLETS